MVVNTSRIRVAPIAVELADILDADAGDCDALGADGYSDLLLTFSTASLRALFPVIVEEPGYFTLSFDYMGESYSASDLLLLED